MRIGPRHALFIDFDGTLIDLANHPSAIQVPAGLTDILSRLHEALGGALAIVTGRPITEIDQFLGLPDQIAIAGVHGAQLRVHGEHLEMPGPEQGLQVMRAVAEDLADEHPALFIEPKPVALAVHYRADPAIGDMVHQRLAEAVADLPNLKLMRGHAVSEVKPAWADKGGAIERLMTTERFAGRVPVMIGDDVTDEDGFRVALARGGFAIKVGPGDTVATERLAGPADVRDWLADALSALETA